MNDEQEQRSAYQQLVDMVNTEHSKRMALQRRALRYYLFAWAGGFVSGALTFWVCS